MLRKLLIVSSSLNPGGLEKCLIQFCNRIDSSRYEVDLYLFNDGRELLPALNPHIRLLPESPFYSIVFNRPLFSSLAALLKRRQFALACYKLGRFLRTRFHRDLNTGHDWRYMKRTMLSLPERYDTAIGFEEGTACYYVAECVNAARKIGWIHTDLKMISTNAALDEAAFEKLDAVCTVSQNSLRSLSELYPRFLEKYRCFKLPTMLDYPQIDELAQAPCDMEGDGVRIVSVGRLVELKGFHLCIRPLKRLLDEGYRITWYIAGGGEQRETLEQMIRDAGVERNFILLGNCANPYAVINNADICVQPSSYEGFSTAVWEEKYLRKPVIATAIPSNQEMITDGLNGLLIDRTEEDIYRAVKKLLDDPELRGKMGNAVANGYEQGKNLMPEIEKLF